MAKKKPDHSSNLIGVHHLLYATLFRRHRFNGPFRHLFPLLSAISACILLLFAAFSILPPPTPITRHYAAVRNVGVVEANVDQEMLFRVPSSGGSLGRDLWSSRLPDSYCGCSDPSDKFLTADMKTHPNRYLLIVTSGGLNQQRTGITDAVVAAYILNATLVVPNLDQKSFWKDSSNFSEIFDVNWFISYLSKDVEIIKQLPEKVAKTVNPYRTRAPRKCTPKCYQNRILPLLIKRHVVQLSKFDYRLSNRLDPDLQKLRCRVNYHALRFTDPILEMAKKLVERMRRKSKHFIALHLRFEPDMLAFSGCYYGGGETERRELGAIRKRWKTLHASNPDKGLRQGKCPLTPEEVGLMLRALGYGSEVHVYVASGEVYGGEETLTPLKALFPNLHSKETIARKEELAPFSSFSSRMAALDFIVCDESDVFVSNNNGNMARMLAGRRRYFGHKPTIRPNAKKLYQLFMNHNNMTWEDFASGIQTHQIGFMGKPNELKPGIGEFHENPSACICEEDSEKISGIPGFQTQTNERHIDSKITGDGTDEHLNGEDQDWSYVDYGDVEDVLRDKGLVNRTDSYTNLLLKPEGRELEEIFSD